MLRRCIHRCCTSAIAKTATGVSKNEGVQPTASALGVNATDGTSCIVAAPDSRSEVNRQTSATSAVTTANGVTVLKDYKAAHALRLQRAADLKKEVDFSGVPQRYRLIEAFPGDPLGDVKIKFLLACRKHHPAVPGGDAETFLRISLAYQDIMKDYGLEFVGGRIRNLGNFQACSYLASNYLAARSEITEFISLSTLDDHIRQLEEAQAKVGEALAERIAANNTASFWLLEDIETVMEAGGTDSVVLSLLTDGSIKVDSALQLTSDPLKMDLIGESSSDAADSAVTPSGEPAAAASATTQTNPTSPAASASETAASQTSTFGQSESKPDLSTSLPSSKEGQRQQEQRDQRSANSEKSSLSSEYSTGSSQASDSGTGGDGSSSSSSSLVCRAEVTRQDVLALTAKYRTESRVDIAGEAARAATNMYETPNAQRLLQMEYTSLISAWVCLFFIAYYTLEEYGKVRAQIAADPSLKNQITKDTMLPWWGNDATYEVNVKRIFVEEWRRARSSAQRQRTYQDGVARESLPLDEKEKLDLAIFGVTAERLRKMKDLADSTPGKQ